MKVLFSFCFLIFLSLQNAQAAETFGESVKEGFEKVTEKTVDLSKKAGKQITDASITSEVKAKLLADDQIKAYNINVDTKRRIVYLKGSVPTRHARSRAVAKAKSIRGVRGVVNMLRIGN